MISHEDRERLRAHFSYDAATGAITRTVPYGDRRVGTICPKDGYLYINFAGHRLAGHRIAWFLGTGRWPRHDVAHINGRRLDNRLRNLRDVPRRLVVENARHPNRRSTSGFLGVAQHHGKWRAQIQVERKTLVLGRFDDPAAAHAVYLQAKRRLHAGCTI